MKIYMYNPNTHVVISTVPGFRNQWEKLGFIVLNRNVALAPMAG